MPPIATKAKFPNDTRWTNYAAIEQTTTFGAGFHRNWQLIFGLGA
jgi:hypothetical protein